MTRSTCIAVSLTVLVACSDSSGSAIDGSPPDPCAPDAAPRPDGGDPYPDDDEPDYVLPAGPCDAAPAIDAAADAPDFPDADDPDAMLGDAAGMADAP